MHIDSGSLGLFYIILGLLILFLFAGQWLFQSLMILLALYLLSKGCSLRGMPGLRLFIIRCLDRSKNYY